MRNRRWKHRLGPLIIYSENDGIVQSVRNIRGIDFCNVSSLNLLKLAPGGHIGRLIIWTESAFRALNVYYGTCNKGSKMKKGFVLPRPIMTNCDLSRIINSQEIQSVLKPKRRRQHYEKKRDPLKHPDLMAKLNPLFDEQWQELKKNYKDGARPKTTKILGPMRKKQRVRFGGLTKEEREQMKGYWNNVFGDDKIFKSKELLDAEKEAVKAAIDAAQREKEGKDLMEALAKAQAKDNDDDDDDDSD